MSDKGDKTLLQLIWLSRLKGSSKSDSLESIIEDLNKIILRLIDLSNKEESQHKDLNILGVREEVSSDSIKKLLALKTFSYNSFLIRDSNSNFQDLGLFYDNMRAQVVDSNLSDLNLRYHFEFEALWVMGLYYKLANQIVINYGSYPNVYELETISDLKKNRSEPLLNIMDVKIPLKSAEKRDADSYPRSVIQSIKKTSLPKKRNSIVTEKDVRKANEDMLDKHVKITIKSIIAVIKSIFSTHREKAVHFTDKYGNRREFVIGLSFGDVDEALKDMENLTYEEIRSLQ